MKKVTALLLILIFPAMAITQLPGGGGKALILKTLNNQLSSQVNPIVFPAFGTTVTKKIMRDQLDKYFPIIKKVVNAVNKQLPNYVVQVTGYANPPGDKATAAAKAAAARIATKRARNVRAVLIRKGLRASVLIAKGMADADRVTQSYDGDAAEWGKNRRVVLKIVKK